MNRLSSDTAVLQNAVTVNVSMGLRFGAQVSQRLAPCHPQAVVAPGAHACICVRRDAHTATRLQYVRRAVLGVRRS